MKNLNVMIVGCIAIVVSGCNITFLIQGEPGSGVSATEDREVDAFDAISLSGSGKINVVCGQPTSLEVTTDDNLLELIRTEVHNGKLKISNTEKISPTIRPEYAITTEQLDSIRISGSGTVDISDFEGKELDFHISGSGRISVIGNTDTVSISIAGSGSADLTELQSKNAEISISGSGRVKVNASQSLKVSIAGSGRIDYSGDPKITKSIAGSGRVKKMTSQKVVNDAKEVSADAEPVQVDEDEETTDEDEDSE